MAVVLVLLPAPAGLGTDAWTCGAVALGAGEPVAQLAIPAAMAASCAFMLPVATPPNAIVYGSGYITIPQMIRAGFLINLAAIVLLTLLARYFLPFLGLW